MYRNTMPGTCILAVCAALISLTAFSTGAATAAPSPPPTCQGSSGNHHANTCRPRTTTVKSGDRFWVIRSGGVSWCTIAAVGRWRGRAVALTAGHCGSIGSAATNDRGQRIGQFIASVKPNSSRAPEHAFIALGPKVTGVQTLSGVAAPKLGQLACKDGWGLLNQGIRCGVIYGSDAHYAWSQISMFFGDSGGPVIQRGKLVGVTSALMRKPGEYMVFGRADKISGFSL